MVALRTSGTPSRAGALAFGVSWQEIKDLHGADLVAELYSNDFQPAQIAIVANYASPQAVRASLGRIRSKLGWQAS